MTSEQGGATRLFLCQLRRQAGRVFSQEQDAAGRRLLLLDPGVVDRLRPFHGLGANLGSEISRR
jgi:hypothetical protein